MSEKQYYYQDEVLGRRICIRRSMRAKLCSIKIKGAEVILVIPHRYAEADGIAFLKANYEWVKQHLALSDAKQRKPFVFDENMHIVTPTIEIRLERVNAPKVDIVKNEDTITILWPQSIDIYQDRSQVAIRVGVEGILKKEAICFLPNRVASLAKQFGFSYQRVSVRSSRSRWGSCSSKGNLSFSLYVMLLPIHLVDYVILHELCHTKEMNHSASFWALMRKVTDGKSDKWRKEMKNYTTDF